MYRVADAHTHIYALKIAEAATSGIFNFYGFPYHEVPAPAHRNTYMRFPEGIIFPDALSARWR